MVRSFIRSGLRIATSLPLLIIVSAITSGPVAATTGTHTDTDPKVDCGAVSQAVESFWYEVGGTRYSTLADVPAAMLLGAKVTAHVVLKSACLGSTITLAGYEASGNTWDTSSPQKNFNHQSMVFNATSGSLMATVPNCYYQADLYIGPFVDASVINAAFPLPWHRQNLIDWRLGGGTACRASSTATPTPTPTSTPTSKPTGGLQGGTGTPATKTLPPAAPVHTPSGVLPNTATAPDTRGQDLALPLSFLVLFVCSVAMLLGLRRFPISGRR